jgi:hypothetical protein
MRLAFLALLALIAAACGPSAGNTRPSGPVTDPRVLYPLGEGYVWNYNVDTGTGLPTLSNIRVTEVHGETYTVAPQHGETSTQYRVDPGGIFRPQHGVFLLKGPVRLGSEWESTQGRTARVTSVTATVQTSSGDFEDCVEVTESGGDSGLAIRTVYCPNVGPALLETTQTLTLSPRPVRVTAILLGYSFPGAPEP